MTKKCLVIDDVEVSRYVIGEVMSALGFEVMEAEERKNALQMVKSNRFDVIFLDWHLKKASGLDIVPEIRECPNAAHTPIIVCTGVEMEKDFNDIRGAGIQGFLKKPTSPDNIKSELHRLGLA